MTLNKGEIRRVKKGKVLLIPTANAPKYARKSGGHKKILAHKKTLTKGKSGSPFFKMKSGYVGIFQRKGKKRLPIKAIYKAERHARIKPRFNFKRTAHTIANRMFKRNFLKSLASALKSAR